MKTSVTVFPTPIGTAVANGVSAALSGGSLTTKTGSRVALSTSALQGGLSNVGVATQFDHQEPICLSAATGSVGSVTVLDSALQADWSQRISQPGVVWYHDFRNEAEVDNFRWTADWGNDPLDNNPDTTVRDSVRWLTTDGITGGACLETLRRAPDRDGSNWWRPFSPMNGGSGVGSGNGRGIDDPADNGNITVKTWVSTPDGPETQGWGQGNYGHPIYNDADTDGNAFYIQFAAKIHPDRELEPEGGKLCYLSRTVRSLTDQEIVTKSRSRKDGVEVFDLYRSGTGSTLVTDPPGSIGDAVFQPGSDLVYPSEGSRRPFTAAEVWHWPLNTWFHLMYYVVPGRDNVGETILRVWTNWDDINNQVADGWIKVWDQNTIPMPYYATSDFAYNAFIASGYLQNDFFTRDIWQRFDQIIFSKRWLPPPSKFSSSALKDAAEALSTGGSVQNPISRNPNSTRWDISWQNVTAYYDESHEEIQYMGKWQASAGGNALHYVYDEQTDTWSYSSLDMQTDVFGSSALGHVWNNSFDHTDDSGDYYFVPQDFRDKIWIFDRSEWAGNGDETAWIESSASGFTALGGSNASIVWGAISADAGMAHHPNLFGQGRPGVICFGVQRLSCWDKFNDSWTEISQGNYAEYRNNVSLYVPGHDSVVYGTGQEGGTQVTIFPANFGNTGTGLGTQRTPPIEISGGNTNNSAHMILDPRDNTKSTIMLLERAGTRVWTTDDLFQTWTLETFSHPFFTGDPLDVDVSNFPGRWTCCSIPRYGCVLGMGSYGETNGSQFESLLWKPN